MLFLNFHLNKKNFKNFQNFSEPAQNVVKNATQYPHNKSNNKIPKHPTPRVVEVFELNVILEGVIETI